MTDRAVRRRQEGARARETGPTDPCTPQSTGATTGREGFEALYRRHRPGLLRFITAVTQRPALAEEVFDDTMLVVWRKARDFDPITAPPGWIFEIAYRLSLKARHKLHGEPGRVDGAVEFIASPAAESTWQREELRARLRSALASLSAEHRGVLELTYYQGYSCAEAARIMGCPVDTVKSRLFYARRKLKARLGLSRDEAI
jgi:RNA polymerase sigma-70 factor (ECF subfamily)